MAQNSFEQLKKLLDEADLVSPALHELVNQIVADQLSQEARCLGRSLEMQQRDFRFFEQLCSSEDLEKSQFLQKNLFQRWIQATSNSYGPAFALGYAIGMQEGRITEMQSNEFISKEKTKNATRKRRADSLQKKREARMIYRSAFRHFSKEDAAFSISKLINRSAETVKRYLMNL